MIACKFLAPGAVGPFSGFRWAPGKWVEAVRPEEGFGIHACRPRDLSWWINAELWRVELDGPVREHATQIEARRGRLLDRIPEWDAQARNEFGLDCVFQARNVSAAALRTLRYDDLADRLATARTLQELVQATSSVQPPPGFAGEMFGYAADAGGAYTVRANAAEASFMVSIATAAARGHPSGFDEERLRESHWLARRLGISPT